MRHLGLWITLLTCVNHWRVVVNQSEYRAELRGMSTDELVALLTTVRAGLRASGAKAGRSVLRLTDDWQAREILAEVGVRQLRFPDL